MLGRYDEAELLARQGRELGDEHDVATQILWRQVQALVLASRREHDAAERALNFQADTLCEIAERLQGVGRMQEAAAQLEEVLERYRVKHNLAMVAQPRRRAKAMHALN
jgi:hypothetical protein